MIDRNDHPRAPRAEQLAAYLDGELSAAERARVEQWLATHPEARADVEAQRHLGELWKTAAASEPSEQSWREVWARVETGLSDPRRRAVGSPRAARRWIAGLRRWTWAAAVLTVAAAGLLLTWMLHGSPPEPLPVTSAGDVEIISVDAADAGRLVVGDPPLHGPLVLAGPGDIVLEHMEAVETTKAWRVSVEADDPAAPMIVAPLARGPSREH